MAVVYHWKHGWIPLDHQAALSKAKGNHAAAAKMMSDAPHATGIKSRQDVAKAALDLPNVPESHRPEAHSQLHAAASAHDSTDLLPSGTSWQRLTNGNRVRQAADGLVVTDGERTVHIQGTSVSAAAAARRLATGDLRNLFHVSRKKSGDKFTGTGTIKLNADGTYTGPKAWALK